MNLRWRKIGAWVALGLGVWTILLASPLGRTTLDVSLSSSAAGNSSVWFSVPSDGSDGPRRVVEPIREGPNTLSFRYGLIQLPFTEIQAWRPCDCAATVSITDLSLRSPLFTRHLELSRVAEGPGVLVFERTSGSLTVSVDPGAAASPTLTIAANTSGFLLAVAAILLGLALAITAAIFGAIRLITLILDRNPRATAAIRDIAARLRAAVAEEQLLERGVQRAAVAVPLFVVIASAAVLVAGVVMMLWGAFATGIWIDEPIHAFRMEGFLDEGWYLPLLYQTDGMPSPDVPDTYVYGPVQAIIGHALAILFGAETLSTVAITQEAYAARHIGVALVAILGVAATGGIARVLLGSWRWALVAGAAVVAIPLFTGHGMVNVKDVAVSTGYTLGTLGFILLARARTRRGFSAGAGVLVLAMLLGVGTRPGIWPAFLAGTLVMIVATLVFAPRGASWPGRVRRALVRGLVASASFVLGWIVLTMIYPHAFGHPLTLLRESFDSSAGYREATWRRAGPGYIPSWMIAQVPTVLLILSIIGLGFAIWACVSRLVQRDTWSQIQATGLALVGAQLLLIPLFSVLRQSVLYSGIRQVEFILPAIAVLFAFTIYELLRRSARRFEGTTRKAATVALGALATLALLVPTIEQAMLFPYNTLYVTRVGEALLPGQTGSQNVRNLTPGGGELVTRELTAGLSAGSALSCGDVTGSNHVAYTPLTGEYGCLMMRTLAPFAMPTGKDDVLEGSRVYVIDALGRYQATPEDRETCEVVLAVTRPGILRTIPLGELLACPPGSVALSEGVPVAFGDDAHRAARTVNWSYAQPDGVWSLGSAAGLRFEVPPGATGDHTLTIRGYRFIPAGETRSMDVLVNGDLVASADYVYRWTPVDLEVPISASMIAASGGVIFLQLNTPDPVVPAEIGEGPNLETLGFWLESVTLSSAP